MDGYFDRDVYTKIACCNIWSEAIAALGITNSYRLPSSSAVGVGSILKRRLASRKITQSLFNETVARAGQMAASIPVIDDKIFENALTDERFNIYTSIDDIDPGEAQLAIVALQHPGNRRLITGDKRFLRAMKTHFEDDFALLRPHAVTFEECLIAICANGKFNVVHSRLIEGRGCDEGLNIALGVGKTSPMSEFLEALKSYNQY